MGHEILDQFTAEALKIAPLECARAGESAALARVAELEKECRAYARDRQATRPLLENVLAAESAALEEVARLRAQVAELERELTVLRDLAWEEEKAGRVFIHAEVLAEVSMDDADDDVPD